MFFLNPTDGKSHSNTWKYGIYVKLKVDDPIYGPLVLWSLVHIHLKLYVRNNTQNYFLMTKWVNISSKNIQELILIRLFKYLKQCIVGNKYKINDESVGGIDFSSLSKKVLHENKQLDYISEKHCTDLEDYLGFLYIS